MFSGLQDTSPNVLIVDDAPDNLNLLQRLLADEAYEIRVAPNGEFALRAAEASPPDLILLDIHMPELDGFEVCKRLKSNDLTRDIPIIFLTALSNPEDEGRGLKLGAVDYITKPFQAEIIKARLRTHLKYVHQRNLLEQLAKLDPLTEIPNRRFLNEQLEKEWSRSLRSGSRPLSVAILDVDFFKKYNDSMGHPMGDTALIAIARTMTQILSRPADLAARFGGEEFFILLPDTDQKGAEMIAEQIRKAVEALALAYPVASVTHHLSVSIGGTTALPSPGIGYSELIKRADANLYEAKNSGRNRVFWPGFPAGEDE